MFVIKWKGDARENENKIRHKLMKQKTEKNYIVY